jgi:drug/metabolite transporter (DMT)-like permease
VNVPLWLILSLLCALSWSAADILSKRALRDHSLQSVFWARWAYAIPFLLPAFFLLPRPSLDPPFWGILALSVPLEIAAGLLYLRAIRLSPLSLTIPFLAWTPVFTAVASFALLGEVPGPAGALGIALVAAGSYLLSWQGGRGLLEPIRALGRERGSLLMLAVAAIFSLTSSLGKIGVRHSSPVAFGALYTLSTTAVFGVMVLLREGKGALREVAPSRWLWAVGAASGVMIFLHFTALELTKVAYMISVKRTSLIFTVLFGVLFLGERGAPRRVFGAGMMFGGIVLLGFGT